MYSSCDTPAGSRLGAIRFVLRFGSALNEHGHYHCCVSAGLLTAAGNGGLEFVPARVDAETASAIQAKVRHRVLATYRRRG